MVFISLQFKVFFLPEEANVQKTNVFTVKIAHRVIFFCNNFFNIIVVLYGVGRRLIFKHLKI